MIYYSTAESKQRHVDALNDRLQPYFDRVNQHPLATELRSMSDLRVFMEHHIYAVWDFMCLLKKLHSRIVSVDVPWMPPKDALSANLISSILVEEEGDIAADGSYECHFDMYVQAMCDIGADVTKIRRLLGFCRDGFSVKEAMDQVDVDLKTQHFVLTTFSFFDQSLPELAAAFVFGREGVTSSLFEPMVTQLESTGHYGDQLSGILYYLKRHVQLDEEEHFPKALQMLTNLVGNDVSCWAAVERAAVKALKARLAFMDHIQSRVVAQRHDRPVLEVVAQDTQDKAAGIMPRSVLAGVALSEENAYV